MRNKDKYFNAFKESNGRCNEIELGDKLGLDEKYYQTNTHSTSIRI